MRRDRWRPGAVTSRIAATDGRTSTEATQTAPVTFGLTTWVAPARYILSMAGLPSARATTVRSGLR